MFESPGEQDRRGDKCAGAEDGQIPDHIVPLSLTQPRRAGSVQADRGHRVAVALQSAPINASAALPPEHTHISAPNSNELGATAFCRCLKEPSMAKSILVSLAVLILATSAALAADKTITIHHRHAAKPAATTAPAAAAPTAAAAPAAAPASPSFWGVGIADHELYIKNQHDSGLGQ